MKFPYFFSTKTLKKRMEFMLFKLAIDSFLHFSENKLPLCNGFCISFMDKVCTDRCITYEKWHWVCRVISKDNFLLSTAENRFHVYIFNNADSITTERFNRITREFIRNICTLVALQEVLFGELIVSDALNISKLQYEIRY